jgi:hypothetical protein
MVVIAGLGLAATTSAWGGSDGVRPYDTKSTYSCLTKRPEYKAQPSLQPTKLEYQLFGPSRIPKHVPFSKITAGRGWKFWIGFRGRASLNDGVGFENVYLWFFGRVRDAQAFYAAERPGWPSGKPLSLSQNVFINWGKRHKRALRADSLDRPRLPADGVMEPGVRLTVVGSQMEAEMICSLLRSNGIDCAERAADVSWGAGGGVGGWREILVAPSDLLAARKLLARR